MSYERVECSKCLKWFYTWSPGTGPCMCEDCQSKKGIQVNYPLEDIIHVLDRARQIGHTTYAAAVAIATSNLFDPSKVVVVAPTWKEAERIERVHRVATTSLSELWRESSSRRVARILVFDPSAVYAIVRECLTALTENQTLHTRNEAMARDLDGMRRQLAALKNSLREMVKAFHEKFGHPVREKPAVPSPEEVRFRARLITEEYVELMTALFGDNQPLAYSLAGLSACGKGYTELKEGIDLAEVVDALADLAYVIEGTNLVFGIDSQPVLAEVQRANMSKEVASVHAKDNFHRTGGEKPVKPEGWTPPDIAGVLRSQGWEE